MLRLLIDNLPPTFRDNYRVHWRNAKLNISIVVGKLVRVVHRPKLPKNHDGSINLHLGCGRIHHPAFINVDGIPADHIHYVRAIDDLSPFDDNFADLIYASHCLEHFSHLEVPNILREWFRVVKKGGILRLSVPNFETLVQIYNENGKDIYTIINPLMGGQDIKYNFHHSVFNQSSLTALLVTAGFGEVREWYPGSSALMTFNDWSSSIYRVRDKEYRISLNIEAVKK